MNFVYDIVGNLTVLDLYFKVQYSSKKDNSFQNVNVSGEEDKNWYGKVTDILKV